MHNTPAFLKDGDFVFLNASEHRPVWHTLAITIPRDVMGKWGEVGASPSVSACAESL